MPDPDANGPSRTAGRLGGAMATHAHPSALYRAPILVRLLHRGTALATLRVWYVRRTLGRLLRSLPRPFRLLDAGCGGGDLLCPYAERYGPHTATFVGVDRAPGNVRLVDAYARRRGLPHLSAVQADLADFTSAASFDVVTCITVLQYVPDDAALLARLAGLLRPGGRLVLYVPVEDRRLLLGFEPLRRRLAGGALYDDAQGRRHVHTAADVLGKLRAAGLTIDETTFAYGPAGRLYYELYTLLLTVLGRGGAAGLAAGLAGLALAPLLLLLMGVDFLTPNRAGNGLLVVARRP